MSEINQLINKVDFTEPRCLLDKSILKKDVNIPVPRIPVDRIIVKLDSYLNINDIPGAQRHMEYWLSEAKAFKDLRGEIEVLNELTGLYRMLGKEQEALSAARRAIDIIEHLNISNEVSAGTILLNCATVYKRFGQPERAIDLYKCTLTIYEKHLVSNDARFGALYNNFALAYGDLGHYDKALELFQKALNIMSKYKNGVLEAAITYLNMSDSALIQLGPEVAEKLISEYVDRALSCLETPDLQRNSYYAFVCEKCAAAFGYHGYFMIQQDMVERAKAIYERVRAGTSVLQ